MFAFFFLNAVNDQSPLTCAMFDRAVPLFFPVDRYHCGVIFMCTQYTSTQTNMSYRKNYYTVEASLVCVDKNNTTLNFTGRNICRQMDNRQIKALSVNVSSFCHHL
jgi:hypothetical protein